MYNIGRPLINAWEHSLSDRPAFREWVDRQPDPGWRLLPLTHIAKGIRAEDIARSKQIQTTECDVFKKPLAYFFYGRPAYRLQNEGAIKVESACPFCFIFDGEMIKESSTIFAIDTGAFKRRLYDHILDSDMRVEDFSLERDEKRPNLLIHTVFSTRKAYFEGDLRNVPDPDKSTDVWEFHARAYLELLRSRGRNEPDDRVCSIEVVFGDRVPFRGNLRGAIVPHTMWDGKGGAPWLKMLKAEGVDISGYEFIPGKPPEHYHALLEIAVKNVYSEWKIF